jgi:hypothetical protein
MDSKIDNAVTHINSISFACVIKLTSKAICGSGVVTFEWTN